MFFENIIIRSTKLDISIKEIAPVASKEKVFNIFFKTFVNLDQGQLSDYFFPNLFLQLSMYSSFSITELL